MYVAPTEDVTIHGCSIVKSADGFVDDSALHVIEVPDEAVDPLVTVIEVTFAS